MENKYSYDEFIESAKRLGYLELTFHTGIIHALTKPNEPIKTYYGYEKIFSTKKEAIDCLRKKVLLLDTMIIMTYDKVKSLSIHNELDENKFSDAKLDVDLILQIKYRMLADIRIILEYMK